MAAFKGFGFTSPEEIKTQMANAFAQQMASGDKDQMRAAIAQQAALNIAGTPALRKAQKTKQILQEAQKETPETGDEIADQIAFYEKAQRAAVEAELPEIAMQATERMSELRLVQEERGRLKSAEGRAQAKEKREAESHDMQKAVDKLALRHLTNGVLLDPETNQVVKRFDQLNDEDLAEAKRLQAEDPTLVFRTEDQYIELTEAEKDRKKQLRAMSTASQIAGRSSLLKDWAKTSSATDAFAVSADDFVDLLLTDDAPIVFAGGGAARSFASKIGTHARSLFAGSEMPEDWVSPEGVVERTLKSKPELADKWNALGSDKQALIMELGYALATSREGGRLTDQDVERAIISLGVDNPDPRAVAWIFGRALKRSRKMLDSKYRNSYVQDIPNVTDNYSKTAEALDNTIARLESKYQIDFEDEKAFDDIVNPGSAFNENRTERGTVVRPVGPSGRNKVRDFTGQQ